MTHPVGSCVYCGEFTFGGSIACYPHSDIPAVDPTYSPHVPQKREPIEDFRPEALLDRLVTSKG